jgi:hypothetical protein
LLLPKTLVAAEALFGRSSRIFDDYKGSFKFPLLLSATRNGSRMRYVIRLGDYRGSVEISFLRVGECARTGDRGYHPPVESELSGSDLDYLSEFLLGYLLGYAESGAADAPSFYRVIRSDNVVYGKQRGDLFERTFEDQTEFESFVSTLEAELGEIQARRQRDFVTRLLDRIDCGEVDDG